MQQEGEETSSASGSCEGLQAHLPATIRTIDSPELDGSVYIGEGNTTLVVSLPNERKVLRLRKCEPGCKADPEETGKRRAELQVHFFRNVISELMGRFANEPEIVRCDPEYMVRVMSLIEKHRPEHRRHKKVTEPYATTLPDYTLLPGYLHEKLPLDESRSTFCIEIKPKQGFVEERIRLLRGKCDYCEKQYSKMAKGKISSPSSYCPCDLFSGEPDRMRRAVKGLTESPQNNLRIFKNGRLVWGEGFGSKELDDALREWFSSDEPFDGEAARAEMFQLVHQALLRPFKQVRTNFRGTHAERIASEASERSLPEDSVLGTILRAQRLNSHSVDFVHRIYSKYAEMLNNEMIYFTPKVDSERLERSGESPPVPSNEELLVLRNYQLYRLAKDCSILMAFREIDLSVLPQLPRENVIQISDSRSFVFNNAITDLDPKNVHSIVKHHERHLAAISKVTTEGQRAKFDHCDEKQFS